VAFDSGGGGHAVLLMRSGTFPTLLEQDFTFSAEQYAKGPQARAKSGRSCVVLEGRAGSERLCALQVSC